MKIHQTMKGRLPESDEEKALKGTLRPDLAREEVPIIPLSRMPVVPDWICEHGKRVWREVGPKVLERGHLDAEGVETFAQYCHWMGLVRECVEKIGDSHTVVGFGGSELVNPLYKLMNDAQKNADRIGPKFGILPLDRQRIPDKKDKPKSKLATLRKTA